MTKHCDGSCNAFRAHQYNGKLSAASRRAASRLHAIWKRATRSFLPHARDHLHAGRTYLLYAALGSVYYHHIYAAPALHDGNICSANIGFLLMRAALSSLVRRCADGHRWTSGAIAQGQRRLDASPPRAAIRQRSSALLNMLRTTCNGIIAFCCSLSLCILHTAHHSAFPATFALHCGAAG